MGENKEFILAVIFLAIFIIIPFISAQLGGSCGSPNWVPYAEKQIMIYSKDSNGVCQQEIRDVECASNYDCRLTNQICDEHDTWKCVDADVNLQGEVYENNQSIESENISQNNSIASVLIIALGIIIGLVVLGLLIKKRNKN